MKKFFKEYKIVIITFLILLSWFIYEVYNSFVTYPYQLQSNDLLFLIDGIIFNTNISKIQMFGSLFVIMPSVLLFHHYLHTGYIKNLLTRESYGKVMIKLYCKSLITTLFFPVIIVLVYIGCGVITHNFNIITDKEIYAAVSTISGPYIESIGLFMVAFLINLFLQSIMYVNLGILFCKKYSNAIISCILGYLAFIFLEIIIDVPIATFIVRILGVKNLISDFSLMSVWTYNFGTISLLTFTIYSFLLALLSTIIVYFVYKDKEKVINAIEREN